MSSRDNEAIHFLLAVCLATAALIIGINLRAIAPELSLFPFGVLLGLAFAMPLLDMLGVLIACALLSGLPPFFRMGFAVFFVAPLCVVFVRRFFPGRVWLAAALASVLATFAFLMGTYGLAWRMIFTARAATSVVFVALAASATAALARKYYGAQPD